MAARLQDFYNETVVPRLRSELKIENAMQVPRITKITINMGVGEAVALQHAQSRQQPALGASGDEVEGLGDG